MGFSIHDSHVRVDRFKESGKWYDTLEVDMSGVWDHWNIAEALTIAIDEAFGGNYVAGWIAQGGSFVCLEPSHKHAHPVMLR